MEAQARDLRERNDAPHLGSKGIWVAMSLSPVRPLAVSCKSQTRCLFSLSGPFASACSPHPSTWQVPHSTRRKYLWLQERDLEALVKRFKTDLHNCVAYIQEPRLLKEKIRGLFEKYVQRADMVEIAGLNTDLQQEYSRQREYLERNLATLKKKVVKEDELHRTDYVRIMQVPDERSHQGSF
ncbi:hypothetical protein P7K49_016093 [Saguinus oedipus]|uniref:Uncharacterized protein n=1 Tax=Saguinus oedipus TaxID=9490 RepID=A0ABQ9VB33_SAGOE|nr:hypothetical protein P7K49_016093 [Saguinus oedipus]